jgi:hypothetical protein
VQSNQANVPPSSISWRSFRERDPRRIEIIRAPCWGNAVPVNRIRRNSTLNWALARVADRGAGLLHQTAAALTVEVSADIVGVEKN